MHRRTHRRILIAAVAGVALIATACSGSSGQADEADAAASSGPIAVTLKDFAIAPSDLSAPAGRPLTFEVLNEGPAPHTFAITAGTQSYDTGDIQAAASATLEVPALEAGVYETLCTVPGHADMGMKGTLVVGDQATASGGSGTSGATGAMPAMDTGGMSAEEMAKAHEVSTAAFPAETAGTGNRIMKPELVDGVKVFELTATELEWEVQPGVTKSAMAYNGQIPGPELRLEKGDRVRIVVQNQMSQPTVMHFHGLTVPNAMDGVPYITQAPIMPGDYFPYEFTVRDPPGTYVYHSHFNSTEQVGKGLFGAFIVEPQGNVPWDSEFTLFTDDGPLGYGLNAKSFPATTPIVAEKGDTVLIRLANDGAMIHPMHLHGYHFKVINEDGFPLKSTYRADTLMIAPGQRFDVLVQAKYPGVWAFHCHILPHVEGPDGMYGMVTALVVE